MKQLTTPQDISTLGTVLGIWAHPDDETYGSAGIMAAAVANGQRVACITATKGEAGVRDENRWPAEQLGAIRARELEEALKVLGVTEHYWLGCHDGDCCNMETDQMASQLCDMIRMIRPDTILTFGPDGLTGHPDHQTVSLWTTSAVEQSGLDIAVFHLVELQENYEHILKAADKELDIYFNIDKPPLREPADCDIYLCMTPDLQEKKHQALMAMPSQMEAMLDYFGEELFKKAFSCESYVKA